MIKPLKIIASFFLITATQAMGVNANAALPVGMMKAKQCVPASVPFLKVAKPWILDYKKCVNGTYGNFAKYEYSVTVLYKQVGGYNVDEPLDRYLAGFQKRVNKNAGWKIAYAYLNNKKYSECPSLGKAGGFYYCEMKMSRIDYVKQIAQFADVEITSFLPGQFSAGRSISISVEVKAEFWE